MATNRYRRTRKHKPQAISEPWKYFLETGLYCGLREIFPDISHQDRVEIFRLANPSRSVRRKLKKIWLRHRDEILSDWKRQKKRGKPWAKR